MSVRDDMTGRTNERARTVVSGRQVPQAAPSNAREVSRHAAARSCGAPPSARGGTRTAIVSGIAALAGVVLCGLPPVRAQESVETVVREGIELRRQRRDREARDVFERAHALSPSARTRAQIALADQALGHWVAAERGLEEALAEPADPWVSRNEASLRAALERVRASLGTLRVELDGGTDADIVLDGQKLAQDAARAGVRTPAGTHQLELRADERRLAEQRVFVPAGGEVVAKLGEPPASRAPEAAPPVSATVAPRTLESFTASPRAELLGRPAASAERSDAVPREWGWPAAVLAGGLLTAGVVAHVTRESNAARYNDDARCFFGDMTRDQRCGRYRTRMETATAVAIGGYSLGAIALGSALTLLLWPGEPPDGGPTARRGPCIDVQLGAGSAYIATRSHF